MKPLTIGHIGQVNKPPYYNREQDLNSLMYWLKDVLSKYKEKPIIIKNEQEKNLFISTINDIRIKSKRIDVFFKQKISLISSHMDQSERFKIVVEDI